MPPLPSRPNSYPPRYLTQPEIRAFLRTITSPRDRLLFTLIYLYGLRVSEVALLRYADVSLDRRRVLIRRVKGGLWSERPLFSSVFALLVEYFEREPAGTETPLFPGNRGPLRKRQIQALFVRYRDAAGLDARYGCHSLRHSIATHLLDAGMSLEFVQDHLGHRKIESTSIYARLTDHRRQAIFEELENSPWIIQAGGGESCESSLTSP